ncbi:MAG: DUF4386 domain-containing protein [Rhodothermales bacterium]
MKPTPSLAPASSGRSNHARWAGLAYIVVIIAAGFAQGGVRERLVVDGNAAETAANILEHAFLFKFGLASDLLAFMADALVAVLLWYVLRPAGRTLATAAATFRLIAHPAIGSLNLLNHYMALEVLQHPELVPGSAPDLALQFMDLHSMGYLIAGAFFGVSLILTGILMARMHFFPRLLAVLTGLAGVAYLMETFGMVLYPSAEAVWVGAVMVFAVAAEVPLALWLAIRRA